MSGFSFLHPALLGFLALAAAPILIHLFNRKRARSHPFAAMEFVLRSARFARKRMNLKSWLLLALRTVAIGALVLAIAGLQKANVGLPSAAVTEPRSVVILLDASASMRFTEPSGIELFEAARREALELLQSLGAADEAALVLFDQSTDDLSHGLTLDRTALRQALHGANPGFRGTNVGAALTQALTLAESSRNPRREIHLFSDFASSGIDGQNFPGAEAWRRAGAVQLTVHDVQKSKEPMNRSLTALHVRKDPASRSGYWLATSGRVQGKSGGGEIPLVATSQGKELARVFQAAAPGEEFSSELSLALAEPRSQAVEIQLPADPLPWDDHRYAWLHADPRVRVLVVDGDPQPKVSANETFYLNRVLSPLTGSQPSLLATGVTLQEFRTALLAEQDLLILANVHTLEARQVEEIRNFVRRGGALWLTLGDQIEPDHFNGLFADLLPARLRDLRVEERGISFQALSPDEPLAREFSRKDLSLFETPRTFRHIVIEPKLETGVRVLWRFASGSPALLLKTFGQGRVALWTTTIDRSWTNFPIQPTFLPFVYAFSRLLVSGDRPAPVAEGIVGGDIALEVDTVTKRVSVTTPSQKTFLQGVQELESGKPGILLRGLDEPGLYRLRLEDGSAVARGEGALFVYVDPKESKLEKIDPAQFQKLIPAPVTESGGVGATRSTAKHSWTGLLLIGCLLFVAAEGLIQGLIYGELWGGFRGGFRRGGAAALVLIACGFATPAAAKSVTPLVFAQLDYAGGDWNARPHAYRALVEHLVTRTSLEVKSETVTVKPESREIFAMPFIWWSGTKEFPPLSQVARDNLRRYLRFGGFLFIDDNQGAVGFGFEAAVRREMAAILPGVPWHVLAKDHTVYRSFYLLSGSTGRIPGGAPAEGLEVDGRTVVLLSHQDLGGALSRDPFGNWEYELTGGSERDRRKALQFAVNIVFYALCDDYKKDALHMEYILRRRRLP